MLPKNFENFELKLQTLREEQRELYDVAENIFQENYAKKLEDVFPRDILGIKKKVSAFFIIGHAENMQPHFSPKGENGMRAKIDIFKKSLDAALSDVPLSSEKKESLKTHILHLGESSETLEKYFRRNDDLSRDPFFALVEDFSIDGEISREEFLLLSESYGKTGNFFSALEGLPENLRKLFESHVGSILGKNLSERQNEFEGEYQNELEGLKHKGLNIEPVARFVARSYYKTPQKVRKYESPARRMRRTMKMSLLRLLRFKLGNVDAEKILKQFEAGENFEDFFMLLYKLLEVAQENPDGAEVYSLLHTLEETEEEVVSSEQTKQKILEGEQLTASISSIMGDLDGELEGEILEKILDEETFFHGDEIQFTQTEQEMAGIYNEGASEKLDEEEGDEEENDDEFVDAGDTLEGKYDTLKIKFQETDKLKRKAFGAGDYDAIDEYNDILISIESKMLKISKLLGREV
ncbi:hypothetical protein N9J72_00975 [Candidatus Gracilibacteria bacterium]|nr:hypothetical protein [Candidatus Gracilibacteria bacterium]